MADNFRNKQWFKNMSQERKDEICKQFDIEEKTLRKAGRETDDGHFVIDLLRIDHLKHYPNSWDVAYNAIKDHINNFVTMINNAKNDVELILIFENIYDLFNKNSYLKYKDSVRNKVLVEQTKQCVLNDIHEYVTNDEDSKPYYANRLLQHIKLLIDSDLKLVK